MTTPTNFARSRFGVNIVPRMNGMSMRVSPSDWPAIVSVVRTIVAAKPQSRIDSKFISDRVLLPLFIMNEEVVVVTGASAGVGRAVARAFGKRCAKVGLIARGVDGLEAAKREIESYGGEAIVLPLDVSDHDALDAAPSPVENKFGPIDTCSN